MEVLNNKQPNLTATATAAEAFLTNGDNLNTSNSVSRQNGQSHLNLELNSSSNYDSATGLEGGSDDEEQSLESWLNPVESDKDYKKVPVELLETINRICQEKSIQYPAVIQAADNYRHILVTGQKVESIQPLLAAAVASKFPVFKIFTRNRDGPLLAKQMVREDAVVVEQMSASPSASAELLHSREWRPHNTALCDLFVQNRVNIKSQVYAVAPAHMNFSVEEKEQAAKSSQDVTDLRRRVEEETTKRFVIRSPQRRIDLSHPPLLHYRHWYIDESTPGQFCPQNRCNLQNSKQLCPHMCMNDIALLRIDVAEATRIRDENKSLRHDWRLVNIRSRENLEQLTNEPQRIRIGDMEGKTTSQIFANGWQDQKYGLHFCFVLTSCDRRGALRQLEPGDCGSIVSLQRPDGRCGPVGMFVGEYHGNEEFSRVPIYQAIILEQALRDVEIDYPHRVEHLTSFRPEEGARPSGLR